MSHLETDITLVLKFQNKKFEVQIMFKVKTFLQVVNEVDWYELINL